MIERAGLVAAVEQAANGIVITDTDGKIQYVNPAFTAMTGYSSEEAVGQYPRILKSGREPVAFYEELVITDTDGKIQYVNPAFTAMTGYSSEEAVGQYPRILKSGREPVAFYEEL